MRGRFGSAQTNCSPLSYAMTQRSSQAVKWTELSEERGAERAAQGIGQAGEEFKSA